VFSPLRCENDLLIILNNMRKKFTIILVLIFVLGLVPVNFLAAISQNQIDAEVQIVCTDGTGSWFSGSGTIIDPKGIILTNRHVIEGAYKNTCIIGFIESRNQEPNFGTEGNYNLAEVKYYTTTDDMDAAILYLDNSTNKSYPYVNIWGSNSNTLQFGDKVEVIGFPSIGGSTITYVSGDFSGFGSFSEGTQNYIKSTAPLDNGNSGGAAYDSGGQFMGIPTMVVPGKLNSMSYILSINSIKKWLSGILGNKYQEEIIEQKPIIKNTDISIQKDITPPYLDSSWYDNLYLCLLSQNKCESVGQDAEIIGTSNSFIIQTSSDLMNKMGGNNFGRIEETYTSYSKIITDLNEKNERNEWIHTIDENGQVMNRFLEDKNYETNKVMILMNLVNLQENYGTYFIGLRFKDEYGNISGRHIFKYVYQKPPVIDKVLSKKLSGKILLQVESRGEAWYVNLKDNKKYYMADGNEAYRIMRYLGVGITNKNLTTVKGDKNFAKKHSGKIFLQVEANGEAYYIDFSGNARYLKDGIAAYTIMRELGLGITNSDLSKIQEGNL